MYKWLKFPNLLVKLIDEFKTVLGYCCSYHYLLRSSLGPACPTWIQNFGDLRIQLDAGCMFEFVNILLWIRFICSQVCMCYCISLFVLLWFWTEADIFTYFLQAMLQLASKLNYKNLNEELMKHFARLQSKDDQVRSITMELGFFLSVNMSFRCSHSLLLFFLFVHNRSVLYMASKINH